jgi:hypothetical protein
MRAILDAFSSPVMVAHMVYEQEQPLLIHRAIKGKEELVVEREDLQPILADGLLTIAFLASDAEEADMVELVAIFREDGEATTAALALQRNWAIGIDGSGSTALLRQHLPDVQLLSTSFFLQQWIECGQPSSHVVRAALQNMYQGTGAIFSIFWQ